MQFTSLTYLAFLPLVLLTYHLVRHRQAQNLLLLAASYTFYGWWDYRFCLLMLVSSLVDFVIGWRINQESLDVRRKWLLAASVGCNLGLLGVFKYFNFFIDNFREVGEVFGFNMTGGTLEIILPIGISFYTFQTMSYTIDIYRRQLEPSESLLDYLAFVSFFPQLVAGPIERARHLLPQLQKPRTVSWEQTTSGVQQIVCGFFKKIVIADSAALIVAEAYSAPDEASGARLVMATILFAFQIYCDFSAYSDIAIGTARLFGIQLMQNFAYPYFSESVGEFWQRWHISLSTWFRDYVYIPMGGNRGSKFARNRNLLLTFIVSGIWHGAAWRFIGWGAFHGAALITEKSTSSSHSASDSAKPRLIPSVRSVLRMSITFALVCFGWVLFRAESIADAGLIWKKMCLSVVEFADWNLLWVEYSSRGPVFFTLNVLAVFILFEWIQRNRPFPLQITHWPMQVRWPAYTLTLWMIAEYADKVPANPFIYFQF